MNSNNIYGKGKKNNISLYTGIYLIQEAKPKWDLFMRVIKGDKNKYVYTKKRFFFLTSYTLNLSEQWRMIKVNK